MILFLIVPVYLLINYYIFRRSLKWMGSFTDLLRSKKFAIGYVVFYSALSMSLVIAFFLPINHFQRIVKLISNYWIGTMMYILLFMLLGDILKIILKKTGVITQRTVDSRKVFAITGTAIAAMITAVSLYGVFHAGQIYNTSYEVTVEKDGGSLEQLNVVLVADLHLGYNIGLAQMQKMTAMINEKNPDLVCIAGDIFDNDYDAVRQPEEIIEVLKTIKSKYGVYAVYGNHDIEEKLLGGFTVSRKERKQSDERMDEFMERANIKMLYDETVLIEDSFYLTGRLDYSNPGKTASTRKTPEEITEELDMSKPVIVLEHQPKQLQKLSELGVDMQLCGHTHDGQLFPGNLTVKLAWENPCGYMKKGNLHSIVTSGVGLWGPNMRVGTNAEVVDITVHFQ